MLQKILFSNFLGANRSGANNNIGELMEKSGGLQRLLDEESFISEVKSGTQRTREYLTYDKFEQLTEFVTVVGDEFDKKRGFKFPLVVCELLTTDLAKIDDYFLPSSGVVIIEEKVTTSVEKEVEQEVDDDEAEEAEEAKEVKEAKEAKEKKQTDETKETEETKTEDVKAVKQSGQEKGKEAQEGVKQDKPEEDQKESEGKEDKQQVKKDEADDKEEKAVTQEKEEFGDFVAAPEKKKKIVKVKQVVEVVQNVSKQQPPLMELLLSYFSQPINYTLTGYVCKIVVTLLNRKTLPLLTLLFKQEQKSGKVIDAMFSHLGSRSMVDLLTRIFTIETSSFAEQRHLVFIRMIDHLTKTNNIDSLSNIVACVGEVLQKLAVHAKTPTPVKELTVYTSDIPTILNKLLEIAVGPQELAASYSISIIYQMLSNFNLKDDADQLKQWLEKYVEQAAIKLQQYTGEERVRLGVVGFKLLESFNLCLKTEGEHLYFSKNKQIFPTIYKLVQKYPLNNIFHNEVFRFMTTCLSSTITELAQSVTEGGELLQWLEEEAKTEENRRESKVGYSRKGYHGHLFNLCIFLKENKQQSSSVAALLQDPRFLYVTSILVDREASDQEKMLGGLAKKPTVHPIIMHDKDKILEAHATFLASTPTGVFEKDVEDPLLNPILLQELQRQLDGVELTNENAAAEVVEEEHHKADMIEQNKQHKDAFWRVHLEYDIDGLMDDLL